MDVTDEEVSVSDQDDNSKGHSLVLAIPSPFGKLGFILYFCFVPVISSITSPIRVE